MVLPFDLVLQTAPGCGDPTTHLTNFEFIKAFMCTYANPMGYLVIGLLSWGSISLSYYVRQGSVIIPTVLLFLVGGAAMTMVASIAQAAVVLLVLVVPAGAGALLYYRYSL